MRANDGFMEKKRLDQFLASQHRHYSRTQIKKLIEDGCILVNGERRKPGTILRGGEKIEMVRRAPEIPKAVPEELPLSILYEDKDILAINKAAGMVVHPAPGHFNGTMVNAVLYHVGAQLIAPPQGTGGVLRPGIVHRLDKGTSGVIVVAKNDEAHRHLSRQFKDRVVEKVYQALVFGKFPQRTGLISSPIGRDNLHRRKFSSKTRHAREAETYFTVKKEYAGLTLLELRPKTGRTHQIRVHLSEAHHPIVGDTLYGAKSFLSSVRSELLREKLLQVDRPLLHAAQLKISHPRSGQPLCFEAPLPPDFQSILGGLS